MIRTLIALVIAAFAFCAQAAVDANKASQAELETVKGIGPGNAAKFSQAGLTVNNAAYGSAAAPAGDKPAAGDKAAAAGKPAK